MEALSCIDKIETIMVKVIGLQIHLSLYHSQIIGNEQALACTMFKTQGTQKINDSKINAKVDYKSP